MAAADVCGYGLDTCHVRTYSPGTFNIYAHLQVKPDTVMIELDASRAGKLIAKRPSAGAGAEAGGGAGSGGGGGAAGDEACRAPPSSIGRLAGRVLYVLWPYTYCGYSYYARLAMVALTMAMLTRSCAARSICRTPRPTPWVLAASSQHRHIGLQPR